MLSDEAVERARRLSRCVHDPSVGAAGGGRTELGEEVAALFAAIARGSNDEERGSAGACERGGGPIGQRDGAEEGHADAVLRPIGHLVDRHDDDVACREALACLAERTSRGQELEATGAAEIHAECMKGAHRKRLRDDGEVSAALFELA